MLRIQDLCKNYQKGPVVIHAIKNLSLQAGTRYAASLGRHFGLSPLVVGLTIVAFGTSSPELAVSLNSALRGIAGLAAGNVVGPELCKALIDV